MSKSQERQIAPPSPRRSTVPAVAAAIAGLALVLAASLTTLALASSGVTVTSAANSMLGQQIVVDAQGRTLYALSPETAHHLLCKNHECLTVWRPLTVHSAATKLKAGPGVHGHLAILRRGKGVFQVMLGGLPLYRFAGDSAKGEANGQHIHSFGGTWHVLSATSTTSPTPTTPTTPTPPTSPPGY